MTAITVFLAAKTLTWGMYTLVRTHTFLVYTGADTIPLRIEQFIAGVNKWPAASRCRIDFLQSHGEQTVYGATCDEVAQKATERLTVR